MPELLIAAIFAVVLFAAGWLLGRRDALTDKADLKNLRVRIEDVERQAQGRHDAAQQEIGSLYKLVKEIDERLMASQENDLAGLRRILEGAGLPDPETGRERPLKPNMGARL